MNLSVNGKKMIGSSKFGEKEKTPGLNIEKKIINQKTSIVVKPKIITPIKKI